MLRASATARAAGLPTVAIVATHFMPMAVALNKAWQLDVPIAEYHGVVMTDSRDALEEKSRSALVPAVISALLGNSPKSGSPGGSDEPEPSSPRSIVVSGSLEDVNDYFEGRLWADGLPIVPPTIGRIEPFLRYSHAGADTVLGTLMPARRQLTPWIVAVNGVMAGCRPEYMPVLMAIAEIVVDPEFRAEDAGSTPGWEPLVIVAGPMVATLDMNWEAGAMRLGRRSNSSIGRFVKLLLRNGAGIRTPPGGTDKATFGYTVNVAMAENPTLTSELGWDPFQVESGFAMDDTVVAVQSVVAVSPPIYTAGDTPSGHLRRLAEMFASTMGGWSVFGLIFGRWTPLLAISPSVAQVLARDGISKSDIRHYLKENCRIAASAMERTAWEAGATSRDFTIGRLVAQGKIPAEYAASADPNRALPMCQNANDIAIIVSGDPGRNQSRAYVNNHRQGPRLVRRVAKSN